MLGRDGKLVGFVNDLDGRAFSVQKQLNNHEGAYNPHGAMYWRGEWVPGTDHIPGDVVTNSGWTMVCINADSGDPFPRALEPQRWILPDTPTWSTDSQTAVIDSGHYYTVNSVGQVGGVRVWVPEVTANYLFRLTLMLNPNSASPTVRVIDGLVLLANQWNIVGVGETFIDPSSELLIVLTAVNTSASTQITGPWEYQGLDQNLAPTAGGFNSNNQATLVRIHYTDDNAADRTADIQSIISDSVLRFEVDASNFVEFLVLDRVDNIDHSVFTVVLTSQVGVINVLDVPTLTATIPTPDPTQYVFQDTYWSGNPDPDVNPVGFLQWDDVTQPGKTDSAYGVDISFAKWTVNPNWEIVAYSDFGAADGNQNQTNRINIIDANEESFWSRWLPIERENLAKVMNKTIWAAMPPPTWEEVFRAQQFVAYTSDRFISRHDPFVIREVLWLESISVIGVGRAAIILAP
jgi:hypothetical protein